VEEDTCKIKCETDIKYILNCADYDES